MTTITPTHVLTLNRPVILPGVIAFSVYAVQTSPGVYAVEGYGVVAAETIVSAAPVDLVAMRNAALVDYLNDDTAQGFTFGTRTYSTWEVRDLAAILVRDGAVTNDRDGWHVA